MKQKIERLCKSRAFSWVEMICFTTIPLVLFYLNNNFYKFRIFLYVFSVMYIGFIFRITKVNKRQLGITRTNLFASLKNLLPAILWLVSVTVFVHLVQPASLSFDIQQWSIDLSGYWRVLIYVLISTPLQELIFRGYLINRLKIISKNHLFLILSSSLIFALVHLPFGNIFMFFGSFILGLVLANNFVIHRNLLASMIGHGIVGAVLVYFLVS